MNQFPFEDYRLIAENSACPNDTGEIFWQECKLLVAPPMPERSKGGGHTKCSPLFSKLGAGCAKFTVTKEWTRPKQKKKQGCRASTQEE